MKACIVIPFFFAKRRFHANVQTFKCAADVLRLAKYSIENYKQLDTGLNTDIIIVNNSPSEPTGSDFLNSINGSSSFSGKFIVIEGHNRGMTFGAHDLAFKTFCDEYDIWSFTEDDFFLTGENFLKIASTQLLEDKNLGFVSMVPPAKTNAHGGCGVTTREKLKEVIQKHGRLPHSDKVADLISKDVYKREQIMNGEIPFTNCYIKMGYTIKLINCKEIPYKRWSKTDSIMGNKADADLWGPEAVNWVVDDIV